jgi:hypothetical protein
VVVEIDNKNGDFGGFVTWPFRQFGNSGVDQEYLFLPLVWPHGRIGHLGEPAPKVPHQKISTSTRLPTVLHPTYSIPIVQNN